MHRGSLLAARMAFGVAAAGGLGAPDGKAGLTARRGLSR